MVFGGQLTRSLRAICLVWRSSYRPVTCGVLQGAVVGPLVFLIFLDAIFRLPLPSKLFLFTYDGCLIYGGSSDSATVRMMNEDMEILDA